MNRLENPMGYAIFDDNILEVVTVGSALDHLPKGVAKLLKMQQAMQLTPQGPRIATGGGSRSIRLANVTSVTMTLGSGPSKAMTAMARVGGLGSNFDYVGVIDVSTTVAGSSSRNARRVRSQTGLESTQYDKPTDGFQIAIMKGQEEEARIFFEGLRTAVGNANRIVLSGSAVASGPIKTCPDCAEDVKAAARKCKHCGYVFTELEMVEALAVEPEASFDKTAVTPEDLVVNETQSPMEAKPSNEVGQASLPRSAKRSASKFDVIRWLLIGVPVLAGVVLVVTLIVNMVSAPHESTNGIPEAAAPSVKATEPAPDILKIEPSSMSAVQITSALMAQGICNKMPQDPTGYDESFQTCYFYNDPAQATTCRWNVNVYQDNYSSNPGGTDWSQLVLNSQPPYALAFGATSWAITLDGFSDTATRDSANSAVSSFLGTAPLALNPIVNGETCGWTPSGTDAN